ncbi:hypothetical protein BDZ91DRAFT_711104 [Kalaharituber pfeilii]|nr:hypothetical protein BDZ91DRAFT_711104 [Kalaharituber pfeilii]
MHRDLLVAAPCIRPRRIAPPLRRRHLSSTPQLRPPVYLQLPSIPADPSAFTPDRLLPALFPRSHFTPHIPAITKWFVPPSPSFPQWTLSQKFLNGCPDILVPIEATFRMPAGHEKFDQTNMPLPLFLTYLSQPRPKSLPSLYLAQHALPSSPLAEYFTPPPPPVPTHPSVTPTLWLGTSVTATSPLHRDPLPNIFVQLAGQKMIRMFPPEAGERILSELLGPHVAKRKIRGQEMMIGEERARVDGYVWDAGNNGGHDYAKAPDIQGYKATVGSGSGVFIPRGWWYAVRAVPEVDEESGFEGVCASVNWWF